MFGASSRSMLDASKAFILLPRLLFTPSQCRASGGRHPTLAQQQPSSSLAAAQQPPSSLPSLRPAARTHIKGNCTRSLSPWRLRISAGFLCSLTVESIYPSLCSLYRCTSRIPRSPFIANPSHTLTTQGTQVEGHTVTKLSQHWRLLLPTPTTLSSLRGA